MVWILILILLGSQQSTGGIYWLTIIAHRLSRFPGFYHSCRRVSAGSWVRYCRLWITNTCQTTTTASFVLASPLNWRVSACGTGRSSFSCIWKTINGEKHDSTALAIDPCEIFHSWSILLSLISCYSNVFDCTKVHYQWKSVSHSLQLLPLC